MEFLLLRRRRPSLLVRSEEKRLFSQTRISCEKNEFNHKSLDFRFLQPLIALLFETTTTSTTEETLKCGKHEIPVGYLLWSIPVVNILVGTEFRPQAVSYCLQSYRCSTHERSRAASEWGRKPEEEEKQVAFFVPTRSLSLEGCKREKADSPYWAHYYHHYRNHHHHRHRNLHRHHHHHRHRRRRRVVVVSSSCRRRRRRRRHHHH